MKAAVELVDQRVGEAVDALRDRLAAIMGITPSDTGRYSDDDEKRLRSVALTVLALKLHCRLDDSDVIDAVTDGQDDYGVDAIVVSKVTNTRVKITFVQSKLHGRLDGVRNYEQGAITEMKTALETLLDPDIPFVGNPRLNRQVDRFRTLLRDGLVPDVTVLMASNGSIWVDAVKQRIENVQKKIPSEWVHMGPEDMHRLWHPANPVDDTIELQGKYFDESIGDRQVIIGKITAEELARLVMKHESDLIEKNVRHFLGTDNSPANTEIEKTLRSPSECGDFYFYNNGITITCDSVEYNQTKEQNPKIHAKNIQIVNGGQTSQIIGRVLKNGEVAPGACVLTRIYVLPKNEELVERITWATNNQNPVTRSDLRANDAAQLLLETSIKELGYQYRRKRNDRPPSPKEFTSLDVARSVYMVWRRKIDDEPEEAALFSTHYGKVFDGSLNGSQAVLACLIRQRVGQLHAKKSFPDETIEEALLSKTDKLRSAFFKAAGMLLGKRIIDLTCSGDLSNLDYRKFPHAVDYLEKNAEEILKSEFDRLKDTYKDPEENPWRAFPNLVSEAQDTPKKGSGARKAEPKI